jgi:hypothetical protein
MTKHEAIEILEEVKTIDDKMFAYSQAYNDALDMAIEALKAQEPRLLMLDEIHDSMVVYLEAGEKFLKIVDNDGVVLAIGGSERMGAKCFITVWNVSTAAMSDEYNVTWRAWSQRPTKEQREATPWN